jgi:elongation factor G
MDSKLSRFLYRETVRDSGGGDEKIIRRDGTGHVYAHVRVTARALNRGKGTVLAWNAGPNIPARFASAVIRGIQDAINNGVLAGLEVTDVQVSVESGSYHEEDSNEDAFREAAGKATTEALRQAHPVILEALALVTAAVPSELVSTVEKTVLAHGGKTSPTSQPDAALSSISTNLRASQVPELLADLLEATEGRAHITSAIVGFQPRPEPPDTIEQWVALS